MSAQEMRGEESWPAGARSRQFSRHADLSWRAGGKEAYAEVWACHVLAALCITFVMCAAGKRIAERERLNAHQRAAGGSWRAILWPFMSLSSLLNISAYVYAREVHHFAEK